MDGEEIDTWWLPPPPRTNWEELESGREGQLGFPGLSSASVPTIAERACLKLARKWHAEAERTQRDHRLTRIADVSALACLALAVEWGSEFSAVAMDQMEANRQLAAAQWTVSWQDELPWELCRSSCLVSPMESQAVQLLTANLDHHNSSIRIWMMEMGWFARPWLDTVEGATRLLKNVANTIMGPSMALGLASRLFAHSDDFFTFARAFVAPSRFENQYDERLAGVTEYCLLEAQAPFWQLESECRLMIEQAILGCRMVPEGIDS